jgi:hypothetical protein
MDSSVTSPSAPAISFVPPAASIAAYEQTKAAIAEAAKGELTHINVDLSLAVRIMLTAAGNTVRYRDELAKLGIDAATKLEQQAHALSYATALHAWTMNVREPIADLAEELVNVRRVLTTELELCELRGVIAKGAVTLEGTTSYLALAGDVRAIGSAFLANWERVGPEVGGKIEHVHAALAKADQLIATLARSEEVQEEQQGAALMRSAAWTLALATYRELERGIAFLRFYEGDADEIVPSLFARPRKRGSDNGAATETTGAGATTPSATGPTLPTTPFER